VLTSDSEKQGNTLKLSNLKAVMSKYYHLVYKGKTNGNEDSNETALAGQDQGSRLRKKNSRENGIHVKKWAT